MRAMILAAGYGKRLQPLTTHTPKPLLDVGGMPLICHTIESLRRSGITELVINTSWLAEKLQKALGDGHALGVSIQWSREPSPLETAGGIRQALPLLGEAPFLVINGDIWVDMDLRILQKAPDGLAHLVMVDNPAWHSGGDFYLAEDGKVQENGDPKLTFAGIGVYRPALFASLPPGAHRLAPLLRQAMQTGQVTGQQWDGKWLDVGTPGRLAELDVLLRSRYGTA